MSGEIKSDFMKPKSILSGIQATGKLHIGNYLGALKQFVELQDSGEMQCYFFVADLHALTVPRDPKELRQDTLEVVAEYIAAGLDPEQSVIFIQNHVQEHAELAWIFSCMTPLGELERMTQFKDKSESQKNSVNAGLLTYPALMAADILLYKPAFVPVGQDQIQHLELTRIISRKFNNQYGDLFPEPQAFMTKPLRIMSLKNPDKKMSKTNDEPLYLDDSPAEVKAKLQKAVTTEAGAQNLLDILGHFGNEEQIKKYEVAHRKGEIQYSELKSELADIIIGAFAEFREKKKALLQDEAKLANILAQGAARAREVASQTMFEVKEKIGLL